MSETKRHLHLQRVTTQYGDVLLDEKEGRYWHLNDTAAIVWQRLQDGGTIEEAASAFVESYGIPKKQAIEDAENVAVKLKMLGLL